MTRDPPAAKKTHRGSAGFRVVQIAASPPTIAPPSTSAQAGAAPTRGLLVAHAPSGLVIDGLDIEMLAVRFRRMS